MLKIGWESLYYSVRSLLTNHAVIFFKLMSFSCSSLALSPPGNTEEGKTLSVLLLEHKEDLIRCVTQLRPILEFLETGEEEFLTGSEKRVTVEYLFLLSAALCFKPLLWHRALFTLQYFFTYYIVSTLKLRFLLHTSVYPLHQLAECLAYCSQTLHL